jgi:Zn-dependent peptidase ImmA (M78 family)
MRDEQQRRRPPQPAPWPRPPTRDYAELKATALLALARIARPPVDVDECARVAGVALVSYIRMREDKSAMLMLTHENVVAILVNEQHARVRQRFSIAHEIGHWVLERVPGTHELRPIAARARTYNELEGVCDYFATSLLMPRNWISERVEWGMTNGELAKAFDVSMPALIRRLKELGYYSRRRSG